MKRKLLFILILGIGITGMLFGGEQFATKTSPLQPLNISIVNQPESPIKIHSPKLLNSDPLSPVYSYDVTNVGGRGIFAYVINNDLQAGPELTEGVDGSEAALSTLDSVILKPGKTKKYTVGMNAKYSEPIKRILLSVDYVAFVDGSRWGEDSSGFSEAVSGLIEGQKALHTYFRGKLESNRDDEVLAEIDKFNINTLKRSPDKPTKFNLGFESAVKIEIRHFKRMKKKDGLKSIKRKLKLKGRKQ